MNIISTVCVIWYGCEIAPYSDMDSSVNSQLAADDNEQGQEKIAVKENLIYSYYLVKCYVVRWTYYLCCRRRCCWADRHTLRIRRQSLLRLGLTIWHISVINNISTDENEDSDERWLWRMVNTYCRQRNEFRPVCIITVCCTSRTQTLIIYV